MKNVIHLRSNIHSSQEALKLIEEHDEKYETHLFDRGLYMGYVIIMHVREHRCFICQRIDAFKESTF